MAYILIEIPPFPFFVFAGDALFRPGDFHRKRTSIGCFDVLIVEYGCLHMMDDGTKYEVRQNDVLVLHPEHTHRSFKGCDENTYFHWLHFYTTEHISLSDSIPKEHAPKREFSFPNIKCELLILPVFQNLGQSNAPFVFKLLTNLESLAMNRYHQSALVKKSDMAIGSPLQQQELFLNILSKLCLDDDAASTNRIAKLVMLYLQSNYAQDIQLKDLASAANCHHTHVIRCFNKEYHTTPGKALTNIRIEEAKRLLTSTDLPCERIAELVGFSSSSYFSKVFKEQTQMSPQGYRKQIIHIPKN